MIVKFPLLGTGFVADCCVLLRVFDLINAGKYIACLKDAVSYINVESEDAPLTVLNGHEYVHLKIAMTEECHHPFLRHKQK